MSHYQAYMGNENDPIDFTNDAYDQGDNMMSLIGFVTASNLHSHEASTPISEASTHNINTIHSGVSLANTNTESLPPRTASRIRYDLHRMVAALIDDTTISEEGGIDEATAPPLPNIPSRMELSNQLDAIKAELEQSYEEFCKARSTVVRVERDNRLLGNWVAKFEADVLPSLSLNDSVVEHLDRVHVAITALVEAHLQANNTTEAKTRHATSLARFRQLVSYARLVPAVSLSMQCALCMDRSVDRVNVPCGHSCCHVCHERIHAMRTCHVCRSNVNSVQRLFLS